MDSKKAYCNNMIEAIKIVCSGLCSHTTSAFGISFDGAPALQEIVDCSTFSVSSMAVSTQCLLKVTGVTSYCLDRIATTRKQ